MKNEQPQDHVSGDHVDVLIIGSGISGIGAAYHLQTKSPTRSFAILEGRDSIGGTWDLFKYPGIRSDSDMYTLGYAFKPWKEQKAIADGPSIMNYLHETADENDIRKHIRFHHMVKSASWSTQDACWTLGIEKAGEPITMTCNFLFLCGGYYSYKSGYTPDFEGTDSYEGQIVHPQFWPEDLDYKGKRVIVIGSGATAVTIVPEVAKDAGHVTMLQRSPTYMGGRPAVDASAIAIRKFLPSMLAYQTIRWRNVLMGMYFFNMARKKPKKIGDFMIKMVKEKLPEGYDVETHFTPHYNPWDQRICAVTDDDLFKTISDGSVSVVTDHIETFTPKGIRLKSGTELEADIIITATGLNLEVFNGLNISVDGKHVDASKIMAYKGMMYTDVPNMASSFGYTNASWTLKCDLTCEYVCRLLNHMEKTGTQTCTPKLSDPSVTEEPWLDFSSGYVQRSIDKFPKQGSQKPWKLNQNYFLDLISLRYSTVNDGTMEFSNPPVPEKPQLVEAAE